MKKRASAVAGDKSTEAADRRSGKAEFAPGTAKRFADLLERVKQKHGNPTDKAIGEMVGKVLGSPINWDPSGISRLRTHKSGLTGPAALALTALAGIDYESFVLRGAEVPRGSVFDVRSLPSFATAKKQLLAAKPLTPVAAIELAADMLSPARPKSVTLAMLDVALVLGDLAKAAPTEDVAMRPNAAELRGVEQKFAEEHAEESVTPKRRKVGGS